LTTSNFDVIEKKKGELIHLQIYIVTPLGNKSLWLSKSPGFPEIKPEKFLMLLGE